MKWGNSPLAALLDFQLGSTKNIPGMVERGKPLVLQGASILGNTIPKHKNAHYADRNASSKILFKTNGVDPPVDVSMASMAHSNIPG